MSISEGAISGGECLACGLIHAPAQYFGCERCGAHGDRLAARELPGSGTVVSRATVHVHRFPTPKTPFTVLEVALDAGPVIRALGRDEAAAYAIGAPVAALAGQEEDGLIRFAPVAGEAA